MTRAGGQVTTATAFALVSATLMIAHQVGGKATRDAIFLSQYDVTELPKMVIAAALLSMLAVVVMSRLITSFGPHRIVPAAFLFSAGLFAGNWYLYGTGPQLAAITLYLQMAVFGAVLISGFWSVVNERFDPHTAKRTIARVAAAATLGGVLGGFMADRVAALLDARAMLVVLASLHVACCVTVFAIGSGRAAAPQPGVEVDSGIQILFRNRYLLMMGLLMVLVAALAALVDYAFKAEAARRITERDALVGFFGRFYALAGVVTFLVQSALGPRMLNRFGIGTTLAVMPAVVILAGLVNTLALRLWSVVLLRGGQMVFQNSFFRSAFELLYTPVPPARKRPTKSIIDVASDRLGDVVGGGIVLVMLAVLPELPTGVVIVAAMVIAFVTLLVVRRLYKGYVSQLAENLRDGATTLRQDEIVDATTRHTLAEVSGAAERELLQQRIAERKGTGSATTVPGAPDANAGERVALAIVELTSGDVRRAEACLKGDFMDPRLVPFIVPLLGDDALAETARTELRWLAPRAHGALADALLDPDVPLRARQRVPSVLEISLHARAAGALTLGLNDPEFSVRYSCARALFRMAERDPQLPIDREAVLAACAREVDVPQSEWRTRGLDVDSDGDGVYPEFGEDNTEINYSMEHVFTLLGLVLERDALRLSFRAVFSSDRAMRGTALEYLENVLPDDIRHGLWAHLGLEPSDRRDVRPSAALLEELKRMPLLR